MAIGSAASEQSTGENVQHFSSIRIRMNGNGNLKMTVYSLDDVRFKQLVPLPIKPTARIIPTRLVNFMEQRAAFEFTTTEMDEKLRVNRIVIFMKEVWQNTPG